jgi:transposase-like protein
MAEHDSELQVISRSRDGRRRYDEKGKRALVEAALRPGMSVARLAQEHGKRPAKASLGVNCRQSSRGRCPAMR